MIMMNSHWMMLLMMMMTMMNDDDEDDSHDDDEQSLYDAVVSTCKKMTTHREKGTCRGSNAVRIDMSLTVSNIHATKRIERDECVYVCVCE